MNIPLYVAIIAALVMMSAYFSATETAFSSLSKTKLKLMSEENKRARLAYKLSENYDKLISTILIGNNIVNIALASLGTLLFVYLLNDDDLGATVSTVVMTIIVLIFGEVCPKSIAKDLPEKFAMFSAPIINVLIFVFTPLTFMFSMLKKLLAKILNVKNDSTMSQEELLMIVDEVQQDGVLNEEESQLVHNAIEFSDLKAEDILTPRVDIEAVPVDADKADIAKLFSETKFSRILVYEDNIDKIIGVIHLKDFYGESGIISGNIKDIMTSPVFILQGEKIDNVLRLLQKNKSHIAVVLDEYGGTYGIVTMEDILEELVGEIWDEHDEVVEEFKVISDDIYIVNSIATVENFSREFDVSIESENVSIGGWVSEMIGKIPEEGDNFEYENLFIKVKSTENHRISEIEVKVTPKEEEAEE